MPKRLQAEGVDSRGLPATRSIVIEGRLRDLEAKDAAGSLAKRRASSIQRLRDAHKRGVRWLTTAQHFIPLLGGRNGDHDR